MSRRALLRSAAALALAGVMACSLLVETGDLEGGGASLPDGAAGDAAPPVDRVDAAKDGDLPTDAVAPDGDAAPEHPYVLAVRADAPRAYLRLEEQVAGSPAASSIAGGPAGTYVGGIARGVEGAFPGSKGVEFDGSSARVELASSAAITGLTTFSLELWFKPLAVDAAYRFLVSGYQQVDGGRESFGVYTQSTYGLVAERYVGNVKTEADAPLLEQGVYHHIVMTYDGAEVTLYIDGAVARSVADSRSSPSTKPRIHFGAFSENQPSVRGALDELAVYGEALSPARVLAHYTASGR